MKHFLTTLIVFNALLLPCGCLPILGLLSPFNPFQTAFITDIHITNNTNHPIQITPIGTMGAAGRRGPLPVYRSANPAYRSEKRGGFPVPANGGTIEVLYNWDDINLSEIVIEYHTGQLTQLVVDPNPTQNQYHPPAVNTFTIDDQTVLTPVPSNIAAAYRAAQSTSNRWWMASLLYLPWITLPLLVWARFKTPRSSTGG